MFVTIWFATHSTSEDNEAGIASGHRDTPLSATGVAQARRVGERYAASGISAVYAADLVRAARTARIAFGETAIPIRLDARLRECDYGHLTGSLRVEVESRRAEFVDAPFPGGESYRQATERHREAFNEIARAHAGETVLIIGCYATWIALEHLAGGRSLEEAVAVTRPWRPGWKYRYG